MNTDAFLTFFVGIFVGMLLPLFFRIWDHTELKSMVEIRKNLNDCSSGADLNQIDDEINKDLAAFSKDRKSSRRFTKAIACVLAIIAVICVILPYAIGQIHTSSDSAADQSDQYAQQQDKDGSPASDNDLEQSVDAHDSSSSIVGGSIFSIVSQALPYLSVLIAVIAAIGAIASAIVSRKVYLSQTRPDVIVYVEHDRTKGSILLWIKNIGNGVAYDISFNIGDLIGADKYSNGYLEKLNQNGISMMAPGTSINSIVGVASDPRLKDDTEPVSAHVTYYGRRDGKGAKLEGEFILDYGLFRGSVYADSEEHQTRKAVEAISKEIARSSKGIESAIRSTE